MKKRICLLLLTLCLLVGCAPAVPTETEPPTEISEPVSESIPESETESETLPETEPESETEWEPQWDPSDPGTWVYDPTDPETWVHEVVLLSDEDRKEFLSHMYLEEYKERAKMSSDEIDRSPLIPVKIYASYFHEGMTMEEVDQLLPSNDWRRTRTRIGHHVYSEEGRTVRSTMFHLFIDMNHQYVVLEYNRAGIVIRVTVYDDLPQTPSYEVLKTCSAGMSLYEVLEITGFPNVASDTDMGYEYWFTNCFIYLIFENGELLDTFSRLLPKWDAVNPELNQSNDTTSESEPES